MAAWHVYHRKKMKNDMQTRAWLATAGFSLACLLSVVAQDQPPAVTVYRGMCDASAAVMLDATRMVVADDEGNILRVYDAAQGDAPVAVYDWPGFFRMPADEKSPEMDLEGAARMGDLVYWIGSHGRNRNGKLRSARQYFFATRVVVTNGLAQLVPEGIPYRHLLADLFCHSNAAALGLQDAISLTVAHDPGLAPDRRGVNIEGLAGSPDGRLWIGFRNPCPQKKALMVPLENPAAVVAGREPARLGAAELLDLGGRGVRSLEYDAVGRRWLVVAGTSADKRSFALYEWAGPGCAARALRPDWKLPAADFTPEALAFMPGNGTAVILSDDGDVMVEEKTAGLPARPCPCKEARDARNKQFRGCFERLDGP